MIVAAGFSVWIPRPRTIRLAGVCATAVSSLADLEDSSEKTSLTTMFSGSTVCVTGQRKSPLNCLRNAARGLGAKMWTRFSSSTASSDSLGLHSFFFLRLPTGQYGPVSQLSRSDEHCTGPFNWGEAHCAGEKVKRKKGPFQWKSL